MVLEFLRGEIDSPRWNKVIMGGLAGDRSVVDAGQLDDAAQLAARRRALGFRGYGRNEMLFKSFPPDCEWELVAITCAELGEFQYLNYPTFRQLSRGSRLVRDGAANVNGAEPDVAENGVNLNASIRAIARAVASGETYAPLIALAMNRATDHILLEGNTRAAAFALSLPPDNEIEVIAGYSPGVAGWHWF